MWNRTLHQKRRDTSFPMLASSFFQKLNSKKLKVQSWKAPVSLESNCLGLNNDNRVFCVLYPAGFKNMFLMETDVVLHHTALAAQRLNLEWSKETRVRWGRYSIRGLSEDSIRWGRYSIRGRHHIAILGTWSQSWCRRWWLISESLGLCKFLLPEVLELVPGWGGRGCGHRKDGEGVWACWIPSKASLCSVCLRLGHCSCDCVPPKPTNCHPTHLKRGFCHLQTHTSCILKYVWLYLYLL